MNGTVAVRTGPATPPGSVGERPRRTGLTTRLMRHPELGALAAVLVIGTFFSVTTASFASPGGIANWTEVASTIGIVSVTVALLMIAGEFDLSAGVMVGSAGLLVGVLSTRVGLNLWVSVAAALVFAAGIGWLNGFVVVHTGLTPAHAVFGGTFSPWDFRVSVLWWLGITVVAALLLKRTRAGNWIFAVGGDPAAARMMAVPVARVKIELFMATSMTAALVGVMVAARLGSVTATQGVGNEFMYIVCAVVGGTLLSGGYGSPVGASLGATIVGMAFIGIQFSGWNTDWRFLFLGVILLLAVLVDNVVRRGAERAR